MRHLFSILFTILLNFTDTVIYAICKLIESGEFSISRFSLAWRDVALILLYKTIFAVVLLEWIMIHVFNRRIKQQRLLSLILIRLAILNVFLLVSSAALNDYSIMLSIWEDGHLGLFPLLNSATILSSISIYLLTISRNA